MNLTLPNPPQIEGTKVRHCPGRPGYAVSDTGRVFTCKNARWGYRDNWVEMKQSFHDFGYPKVGVGPIRGKNKAHSLVYVHALVLEAFIGPCPCNMEACHAPDSDPTNNNLTNLRWGTHADNMKDAIIDGGSPRRLTADDVYDIRLSRGKERQVDTAARFGVSQKSVSSIQIHAAYRHVEPRSPPAEKYKNGFFGLRGKTMQPQFPTVSQGEK